MKGKPAKKMMAKKAGKKMAGKDMKGAKGGLMKRLENKEM